MIELQGKKVLLIAPKFHHYHQEIVKVIEKMGAKVDFYAEVIYTRHYNTLRNWTSEPFKYGLDRMYFNDILKNISENQYDIFFLIRGELITEDFLFKLRQKLHSAFFVMYQWDSLVHNTYIEKIKYFDKVLSFDKYDAEKLKIEYLPLFYTPEYAAIATKKDGIKYDITFFGTYHSDRLDLIKKVDELAKAQNLSTFYHLYVGKIYLFRLLFTGKIKFSDIKYFKTYYVSLSEMIKVYCVSKAILDVEMTNQTGLTIRTIEALGSGRKLLTTNLNIRNSEIFHKDYIYILDRNKLKLEIEFLNSKTVDSNMFQKYSIENWINNILKISNKGKK